MLYLQAISLVRFKNYDTRSFEFKERIVGICGNNGVGKTNLLDAIHYLCFTRGYFSRQDLISIKHGNTGFRIEGDLDLNGKPEKTVCILRETGRKEFMINGVLYDKFSEHIGHYPCVIIVPDDAQLITGGSEERRKFLDALLSQLDPDYLEQLINYIKVLQQRNSLLKSFAETRTRDDQLLDVLDGQLTQSGESIYKKRKEFLVPFLPLVTKLYRDISMQPEKVDIAYESELLQASFPALLKAGRQRDLQFQRTVSGIHRDDLNIQLDNRPFKNTASQGQRKSLLFALKLAEMNLLQNEKGFAPFLLLDDVFEKLDEDRIGHLLQKVCLENNGQVFITDTNAMRLTRHLDALKAGYQLIEL